MPAIEAAPERRVLNASEAGEHIGRSLNFVRRVLRYEVPVVQHAPGGPLGFWSTDLDRWLAKHTQEPVRWAQRSEMTQPTIQRTSAAKRTSATKRSVPR